MKKKARVIRSVIITIIVLAGLAYLAYSLLVVPESRSYTLEYGSIDVSFPAQALILRDEMAVKTQTSGQIQYVIAEGEKVKRNQVVAQITPAGAQDGSEQAQEVSKTSVAADLEKLHYDIAFLSSKIKYAIASDQFGAIYDLREELEMKLKRLSSMGEIAEAQTIVSETLASDGVQLVSPRSGVVSYYIDGYEDILTENNLYAVDFERILSESIEVVNHSGFTVQAQDIVYKLVDSNRWKLIALIDTREGDFFPVGKILDVEIGGEMISGQVTDVIAQTQSRALIIEMSQLTADFQKLRQLEVSLHPSNFKGLVIENTSLVKQGGQYGVYVLNVNNQADYVPVKIIGYDQERAIVLSDSFMENGNRTSTVSLYDEVIRDAKSVK